MQKVQRYVLGIGKKHAFMLKEHENYVIETNYDSRFRSTYMESWGFLSDNRTLFIMSMPLASIRESVMLANRFTTYVGLMALVFGSILMYFVTNRVTKPLMRLAVLSERMSELDFEAKYEGHSQDEIGVLELGMSMPGEMSVIARIARVDMAVITNVGVAHIELLGSQENIYQEKLKIQDGLKDGGILLLNGDDPMLKDTLARDGCRTIYYGTGEHCDYRAEHIRLKDGYPVFEAVHGEKRALVSLKIMGAHHVGNAMAALAAADLYGVDMQAAAEKLQEFTGYLGRQQVYVRDGITIIDDTYNASPVSMKASLQVLASMEKAVRRIAVLADMKELGPDEERFHKEIGEWLSDQPVDVVFTLGELSRNIEAGKECRHFSGEDLSGLSEALEELLVYGDCVLLKGSRSMKLDQVAKRLVPCIADN